MGNDAVTDENEYLDELLQLPQNERDAKIRTDIIENIPMNIDTLLACFVQEKAYLADMDGDFEVLDVIRDALYRTRSNELYKELDQREAEKADEETEEQE